MDFDNASRVDITRIFERIAQGDRSAIDLLFNLFYDELHKIACFHSSRESNENSLQPTAVVHEIYLKLIQQRNFQFQDRAQFLTVGALLSRRILVDQARKRRCKKRYGKHIPLEIDNEVIGPLCDMEQMLDLEKALTKLERLDPRQARIIELRYFGGLTMEEIAESLGLSVRTIESDWFMARAWLRRELLG